MNMRISYLPVVIIECFIISAREKEGSDGDGIDRTEVVLGEANFETDSASRPSWELEELV